MKKNTVSIPFSEALKDFEEQMRSPYHIEDIKPAGSYKWNHNKPHYEWSVMINQEAKLSNQDSE